MERGGVELILLIETNIQAEAYSLNRLVSGVTGSVARPYSARAAQGEVGLVTREIPDRWGIESMLFHGPNVVSCDIVTGHTRTLVRWCIPDPLDAGLPPRLRGIPTDI